MSRTVIMYVEIGCFLSCVCGWILICSTLPTEYWNFSEVGDAVLTTVNYFSNLWMDCVSDTTGVSDCKNYPSMLALPGKTTCNISFIILYNIIYYIYIYYIIFALFTNIFKKYKNKRKKQCFD